MDDKKYPIMVPCKYDTKKCPVCGGKARRPTTGNITENEEIRKEFIDDSNHCMIGESIDGGRSTTGYFIICNKGYPKENEVKIKQKLFKYQKAKIVLETREEAEALNDLVNYFGTRDKVLEAGLSEEVWDLTCKISNVFTGCDIVY